MKLRLSLLFVVAALLAVPSFAQIANQQLRAIDSDADSGGGGWSGVSSSRSGMYLDNPCTAVQDLVYVDYSAYVEGLQTEKDGDRFVLDESTTVSGSYSASGSSQSDVAYLPPYSVRKYYKVNTYDDFHVVTVINFDPSSKTTNVTVETACGNGMPDSKQ